MKVDFADPEIMTGIDLHQAIAQSIAAAARRLLIVDRRKAALEGTAEIGMAVANRLGYTYVDQEELLGRARITSELTGETATLHGSPVGVPARLSLGWYRSTDDDDPLPEPMTNPPMLALPELLTPHDHDEISSDVPAGSPPWRRPWKASPPAPAP